MTQPLPGVNQTSLEDLTAGGEAKTLEQSFADFNDQQQREMLAEQQRAADPASAPLSMTQQLERQYSNVHHAPGALQTVFTEGARGVFDAILAPGALAGLAAEGLGEASGAEWLRDFGRDLGEASSGKSLMQLMADTFADSPEIAPGTSQATPATRVARNFEEQERNWPLLSTLSRIAGQASVAVAGGVASAGTTAPKVLAGIAAAEGAAGGAQGAYENNASVRDIVASTILSGTIGAGLGYAGGRIADKASRAAPKADDIAKAFGAEAKRVGKNAFATVEEVGGVQAKRVVDALGGARDSIGRAIRNAGPNPAAREAAEATARQEVAESMASKVGGDVADWAVREPDALKKFARRADYLDRISADLADDFARVSQQTRPSLDFDLDVGRVTKVLTDDVDAPAAIGTLQQRINSAINSVPTESDEGAALAVRLREVAAELESVGRPAKGFSKTNRAVYKQGAADAMVRAHNLAREVAVKANTSQNPAVRAFSERVSQDLMSDLGSDVFGSAGELYRKAHVAEDALEGLSNSSALRDRLRKLNLQGELLEEVRERNGAWELALDARKQLTGKAPKESAKALKELESRVASAESVLTLDGKSTGRVLDFLGTKAGSGAGRATAWASSELGGDIVGVRLADRMVGMAAGGAIGGVPGMALGYLVGNYVAPYINRAVRPVLRSMGQVAGRQAARWSGAKAVEASGKFLGSGHISTGHAVAANVAQPQPKPRERKTPEQRQEQYKERMELLASFDSEQTPERTAQALTYFYDVSPDTLAGISADTTRRVQQLIADMPRPEPHLGGPAYETLSMQDLQKSEAMWEATMEPMSVFDDFERGIVDYTKVQYVWKQNPGLQEAVRAGFTDAFMNQMDDGTRAYLPPQYLAQIDFLTGANGTLHRTADRGFSMRMSQAFEETKQQRNKKPDPPMSASPMAKHKRTYTQKLMGRG